MKKTILSLAAMLAIAVSLVSCGGGSPKANAQKFLDGLYHMDIAAAKTVATEDTRKQLDGYEQMMGAFMQGNAKDEMKKIKVDVKEPKVTGDNAMVDYTLSNDPASVKSLKMVKQGGDWKAQWSKADATGGAANGGMSSGEMNGGAMGGTADSAMAPAADPNMGSTTPMGDTAHMRSR